MMSDAGFKVVRYGPNTYFLGGELDMATVPMLTDAVATSLEGGGVTTLDLGALTFMDSTGIHALLQMAAELGDRGCILLHAPQPRVRRVLELVDVASLPNLHVGDLCASDTLPDRFLDWRTPDDIEQEFAELRRLSGS
jgi:anti-sigma B factor antagonist